MHERREVRNEGGEKSEYLFPKPMLRLVEDGEGFRKVHGMPDCCGPHEVKLTFAETRAEVEKLFVVENMVAANGSALAGKQFYALNGTGVNLVPVELEQLRKEMAVGEKRMKGMAVGSPSTLFVKGGP
ncbi:MAG: hypothetical protein NT157_05885 [Candidatus Micrarchaeota archaeon]|nr:hypothetical protein [Candidatus Micrarchaeota archaeon]